MNLIKKHFSEITTRKKEIPLGETKVFCHLGFFMRVVACSWLAAVVVFHDQESFIEKYSIYMITEQ